MIASELSATTLGWMVLFQVWVLVLWYGRPEVRFREGSISFSLCSLPIG